VGFLGKTPDLVRRRVCLPLQRLPARQG
jgi:hypothetical protein